MRLFLDQDVYFSTVRFLVEHGHDVIRTNDLGLSRAADSALLRLAQEQRRIFITRDRDFGALVFVKQQGAGVLYLRMLLSTQDEVHAELANVLNRYSVDELKQAFVVIDSTGHRFRHIGKKR
jgi:predicted nuclease of predicted toxin-antitoxin system